jgi:hypothetical protein
MVFTDREKLHKEKPAQGGLFHFASMVIGMLLIFNCNLRRPKCDFAEHGLQLRAVGAYSRILRLFAGICQDQGCPAMRKINAQALARSDSSKPRRAG